MKKTAPDQYGQVHPVETPDLIKTGLSNLANELSKIPNEEKKALIQAQEKSPEVLNDAHKLMFLRCEVFNADLAAARLVKYWEKRLELFGEDRAFKPLTLANIYKEEDEIALKLGFIRLIPGVDSSGRSIIFADPSKLDKTKHTREMVVRSLWYVFHAALETESAQQKGLVLIAHPHHAKFSQVDNNLMSMNMKSVKARIPARLSAFHIVNPPSFFKAIFPFVKFLMGARLRKRIRVYYGSGEKEVKHFESLGIPRDCIPTDIGGNLVLDHEGWIESRRAAGL